MRVFKFRNGTANDLDALYENFVWFSNLNELNDPFEGGVRIDGTDIDDEFRLKFLTAVYALEPNESVSSSEVAQRKMAFLQQESADRFSDYVDEKAEKILRSFYEEHKNECGVYSLSRASDDDDFPSPLTNPLMWGHYARGFRGFCIEFDAPMLKNSIELKNNNQVALSNVNYMDGGELPTVKLRSFMQATIDKGNQISIDILQAFFSKHKSWESESELRFLSNNLGPHRYDPSAITAIYIPEKSAIWLRDALHNFVRSRAQHIKLYDVKLHNEGYKMGFEVVS